MKKTLETPDINLERELKDPEYAKYYGASDAKTEIALVLSEARRRVGKKQQELADAIGHSQPYIAKLEGGEANPTISTIGSLLAVMGFRLTASTAPLLPEPTVQVQGSLEIDTNSVVVYTADFMGTTENPAVTSPNSALYSMDEDIYKSLLQPKGERVTTNRTDLSIRGFAYA